MDLKAFCVRSDQPMRKAIACINRNGEGIALVVEEDLLLVGTVTDGDIRRALMVGLDLNIALKEFLKIRIPPPHPSPLTARAGASESELLKMMQKHLLRHIPLVDESGRVVDVALLSGLMQSADLPVKAVIMAGGYGTRLQPFTKKLPKPLVPIGDRPLLEHIIDQLRESGIRKVNLTTHYKGELIKKHFGDGQDFGVDISYVSEDQPLGTAGALALMEVLGEDPLLVINGDILTRVDFSSMLDFHRQNQAWATVAIRKYATRISYGVVETEGIEVTGIAEKPLQEQFINAGIYLISPSALSYLPKNRKCDMTDLIAKILAENHRVIAFPIHEYWLDIGQVADLERAKADMVSGQF